MTFSESAMISLFCMSVVFAVLVALWALIRGFSALIGLIEKKGKRTAPRP